MFPIVSAKSSHSPSPFRVAVAILCVLLILFVGAADLLHSHPVEGPGSASCPLCVVAHLAAAPAPVAAGLVIGETLRPVPEEVAVAAAAQVFPFALYVRPPPAA